MMVILSHILVKSTINDLNPPLDPLNFGKYRLNETLKWDLDRRIFLCFQYPKCEASMVATLKQKHLINDTIQILREKYVKQSRHDISNKNDTPLDNINITDEANKLAAVHLMDGEATALNAALDSGRNRFKLKESVVAQLFSFEDAGNSNIAFTDEEGE